MSNLSIEYTSPYELEEIIKKHPEIEDEYNRIYAEAIKELRDAELELEILISELVDEICKSRSVPPSAKSEVRRTEVPLDKRYKKLRQKCIVAEMKVNVLKGSVKAVSARGYCLTELGRMTMKSMGVPIVMNGQQYHNYDVTKEIEMDYNKENK